VKRSKTGAKPEKRTEKILNESILAFGVESGISVAFQS
jgi:hypothetical protein